MGAVILLSVFIDARSQPFTLYDDFTSAEQSASLWTTITLGSGLVQFGGGSALLDLTGADAGKAAGIIARNVIPDLTQAGNAFTVAWNSRITVDNLHGWLGYFAIGNHARLNDPAFWGSARTPVVFGGVMGKMGDVYAVEHQLFLWDSVVRPYPPVDQGGLFDGLDHGAGWVHTRLTLLRQPDGTVQSTVSVWDTGVDQGTTPDALSPYAPSSTLQTTCTLSTIDEPETYFFLTDADMAGDKWPDQREARELTQVYFSGNFTVVPEANDIGLSGALLAGIAITLHHRKSVSSRRSGRVS